MSNIVSPSKLRTPPLHLSFSSSSDLTKFPPFFSQSKPSNNFSKSFPAVKCAKRTKRTGKLRYPSERRKLKQQQQQEVQIDAKRKFEGVWRLSKLGVSVHKDPGKDFIGVSDALLQEIAKVLEFPVASMLPPEAFAVVRKSFDARKVYDGPKFVYTVDMNVNTLLNLEPRTWDFISDLKPKAGLIEHMHRDRVSGDLISIVRNCKIHASASSMESCCNNVSTNSSKSFVTGKPKVAVVGSGPSGLFAALVLAEFGADVTLIERGQAVEQRGRDIGALVVRRMLQLESNFCFGEVLNTLVKFGAPESILVDGKPHLGTDRLVPLLRNFRRYLEQSNVTIKFGTRVDDLLVEESTVVGVKVSDSRGSLQSTSDKLRFDAVVLAVGHSARDTYEMLLSHNVNLAPKDFAVGLRVEHPQELINGIQYSELASEVQSGRGKVPVADYKVVDYVNQKNLGQSTDSEPIPRSCYSFCMCPGGQVVLTSTDPSELCINGMSFSKRASRWANAALVVTVSSKDFDASDSHCPLAGIEFQRTLERNASVMGGGNFVVPAQTVTDFLGNRLTVTSLPSSSYRLGVKAANLHELFSPHLKEALQQSLLKFNEELPGFISKDALLHGVETRTSSPVQISRNADSYESISLKGLYPIGEGAGYAGGIVSAAVDGMYAGFALARNLGLCDGSVETILGKATTAGAGNMKY